MSDHRVTVTPPVWRSLCRGHTRGHDQPMSHAIRGGRTLCGVDVTDALTHDGPADQCAECASIPEGHAIYPDLLALGLTPRQVDDWCRKGLLLPDNPHPGFGHRRTWPPGEYAIAASMALYVAAGLRPMAAWKAASNDGWLSAAVRVVICRQSVAQAA